MDAINPTLALAALLFGMSGAHHGTPSAETALYSTADCPALTLTSSLQASPGPDEWSQAFDIDAPVAKSAKTPDPLMRRMIPVASRGPTADPDTDPCAPEQ